MNTQYCPVCGTSEIVQQSGNKFLTGPPLRVISYRCKNGHVFFVESDDQAAEAASGESA